MADIYRQGDLILRSLTKEQMESPDFEPKEKVADEYRLTSESGNSHVLAAPVHRSLRGPVVVLEQPTPLVHPQHETIVIPPGQFLVDQVRDYRGARMGD